MVSLINLVDETTNTTTTVAATQPVESKTVEVLMKRKLLQPLGDNVLVRRARRTEHMSDSGLVLNVERVGEVLWWGAVLAVGPSVSGIKNGDLVYIRKFSGQEIDLGHGIEDDLTLLRVEDVVGLVVDSPVEARGDGGSLLLG